MRIECGVDKMKDGMATRVIVKSGKEGTRNGKWGTRAAIA